MGPEVVGIIGIVGLIALLFSGISVGIAMAIVGVLGFAFLNGIGPALGLFMTVPYSTVASYSMSVVPLFMLMGQFAFYSGVSKDLYVTANSWLGHFRGGLAMASIGASAMFAAICGSSPATTATIGSVALPEMKKFQYNRAFSCASLAAGGTLGILIPPSVGFIVYGVVAEQSIGKLFLAGIIPGVLLATMYMLAIHLVVKSNPRLAPRGAHTTLREKIASLKGTWPMLMLFFGIMVGIMGGIFTANEAGAMGAFGAFLFLLFRRKCTWSNMINCMVETLTITSMIFLILIGAYLFSYFLTLSQLPELLVNVLTGLTVPPTVILTALLLMYLVLGCVMDSLCMIVITTPIFLPVVMQLGVDPIWYGVMMVVAMEQGQITPPVGINLYVITGVAKDVPMHEIFRYILPYIITLVIFMFLLIAFPQLSLFLPNLMS
ncbi:MAG: TRAP transporter large permease [Peptococcaceae bacterium]